MASKFKSKAGWIVYKVSREECLSWGGAGVCDHSNCEIEETGYLIPVMNHCVCKECFDEWNARGKYYPSDVPIEAKNVEYYDSILKIEEGTNNV